MIRTRTRVLSGQPHHASASPTVRRQGWGFNVFLAKTAMERLKFAFAGGHNLSKKHGPSSREELVRENERLKDRLRGMQTSRLSSNIAAVFRDAIKYGSICLAAVLCVRHLAGQTTIVNAAVDVCGSLGDVVKELAPAWWVQIATLAAWPFFMRSNSRLRKIIAGHVERASKVTKERETALDPDRSSSNLGHDGETHERDRL